MTIAQRLIDLIESDATLARLEGDESGLLVPGSTSRNVGIQLAERILAHLAQPIGVDGQMVHISASIGIAYNGTHLDAPHELLQFAGIALEQSRNTSQWYNRHKAKRSRNSVNLLR